MSAFSLLIRELLPPGATLQQYMMVNGDLWLIYKTAQGLREERCWGLLSTTRWPD